MVMNYSVHAIMYSYYTMKALKYPVPKPFAMVITTLQLLQMVGGCIINSMAYNYKQNGNILGAREGCSMPLGFAFFPSLSFLPSNQVSFLQEGVDLWL